MYRIAHFGDLHLAGNDEELDLIVAIAVHALARGADHLVFTGDIVDAGELEIIDALVRRLKKLGLRSDGLSLVPGNHDVYPISTPRVEASFLWELLQSATGVPQRNFDGLSRSIGRMNERQSQLFTNAAVPYGKRLSGEVALAGMDTTRSERSDPTEWAAGQLPADDLEAVRAFFAQHDDATHRVVAMHHYPFDDFRPVHPSVPMKFVEPRAVTVRSLLKSTGATLVLCGHLHEDRERRAPEGFDVIVTQSNEDGRGYSLVTLDRSSRGGRMRIERIAGGW
jgi:3',5'-cyclic AMP phosphodiesterase CpdA